MKRVKVIHHLDGKAGVVTDKIPCVWEYKLPSGKTGTCGATATWELIYKTSMRQPFGAAGNIMLHTYRCDLHHTPDEGTT